MMAILRRLVAVGTAGRPADQARPVRVLNWLCVFLIAVIVLTVPGLAMFGEPAVVYVYGAALCGLVFVVWMNHRGRVDDPGRVRRPPDRRARLRHTGPVVAGVRRSASAIGSKIEERSR